MPRRDVKVLDYALHPQADTVVPSAKANVADSMPVPVWEDLLQDTVPVAWDVQTFQVSVHPRDLQVQDCAVAFPTATLSQVFALLLAGWDLGFALHLARLPERGNPAGVRKVHLDSLPDQSDPAQSSAHLQAVTEVMA